MNSPDLFGYVTEPPSKWSALFSAASDEWPTDQAVVNYWAARVGPVGLDVCATADNAKAPRFYTKNQNALMQDWARDADGSAAWMNPPYSDIEPFIVKALEESARGLVVVALLPARTDRPWFHRILAEQRRCEIWFARGRLRFGDAANDAPFPSVIVIFRNSKGAA